MEDRRLLKDAGWELFEASKMEPNPMLAEAMRETARDLFNYYGQTFLNAATEIHMGDINIAKNSQVGAMGSGATTDNTSFSQTNVEGRGDLNVDQLAKELEALTSKLLEQGRTPAQISVAGAIAKAQIAATAKDANAAVAALADADENALNLANGIGAHEAAEALRRAGIAPDLDLARIQLWAQLPQEEFLIKEEKLGGLVQEKILRNLERFGIGLIRPVGLETSIHVVENLITMIGTPTQSQNEYEGTIKDIRPKEGIDPNTGDSKGDLGFHVDGTQQVEQPAVLLFQYATGATLGANSKFADAAKIIRDIPEVRRNTLLVNLARKDAATFTKRGARHQGPILSFSETNALVCRIRFDDVISLNPECQEDFELLKEKFSDPYYPTVFQPLDGDVVIFDNWRLMHARDEVYGTRQRHHRRVWFANLKLEHQAKYQLGIRPFPRQVAAAIEKQNSNGD